MMTRPPKESPVQAAPQIVGMFLAEWIPGVQKEFELLVMTGVKGGVKGVLPHI
jgi:hypothetical protein